MMTVENLSCTLGHRQVLQRVSCSFPDSSVTAIMGPNGCGKTTLLRHISGELASQRNIFIQNHPIESFSPRQRARQIALLHQDAVSMTTDFRVHDLVVMGRYAHAGRSSSYDTHDFDCASEALAQVGLADFENRRWLSLSGGEKQRVMIARVLCQDSPVMVLDEPMNHLDMQYQLHLIALLRHTRRQVLMVMQDLNMAILAAHQILVLHQGAVAAFGTPQEVITPTMISAVFNVTASVSIEEGLPHVRLSSQSLL